jgi:hypothetical protein
MAIIIPALPYTLTNGTTADANQVMADLNDIVSGTNTNGAHNGPNSDITSLTGLTTPLAANQGGTGIAAPGSANNILQSNGSGLWQATPLLGVTDGSNAAAGQVGEYISSTQATGQALATATALSVTSIVLSAGDWEVGGHVYFTISAGTTIVIGWFTANASNAAQPGFGLFSSTTAFSSGSISIPLMRLSISSPSTQNLMAQASFASGTAAATGTIWARRKR